MLVQDFLRNNTIKDLELKHNVYASFSKSGDIVSLNYDQILVNDYDHLANDCRGLILSSREKKSWINDAQIINDKIVYDNVILGNTCIVAFPFKRFFNYGHELINLNFSDPELKIQEKMDGTLCILYYFNNNWHLATRSVPEADILLDGNFTFRTLFEKALKETTQLSFNDYTCKLNNTINYIFELTTPKNRIVVDYKDYAITLIAARKIIDGFDIGEINIDHINSYGVPYVRTYTYTNINDILNFVNKSDPLKMEGVILLDSKFNRVKLKSESYVFYHKMKDILSSSDRNCMELILNGKDDDLKSFLSEDCLEKIKNLKNGLNNFIKKYDNYYFEIKKQSDDILPDDKKTFANLVLNKKDLWSAPFFEFFSKKSKNTKDFILKNKKNGSWSSPFLDKLIELSKKNI